MAARKRTGRRGGTRKTARKTGARAAAGRKKRASGGARRKTRSRPAAGSRATARSATLAERLGEVVEHLASGALRRVVDTGGRELAGWLPDAPEMRREAGEYLRELREVAGLTVEELADAADMRDESLLEAVEAGTATLSFELILRLAAILARHDPVPFISRMVRSYNPVLWQLLEDWGIGRLPVQLTRERAFVNILRGHDEARRLSDEDFERVLTFTRTAFETVLHFAAQNAPRRSPKARAGGSPHAAGT